MKQITAFLLIVTLLLCLTGCASESEKAFEAANKLLEAGDYEGALDAYLSIEFYQQVNEKIYEAQSKSIIGQVAPYVGTWMDLYSTTVITIHEDGTFTQNTEFGSTEGTVSFDGDLIYLHEELAVQGVDGATHLVGQEHTYVSEADYARFGPQEIEITMENWEQYFELREATSVILDEFDTPIFVGYGYAVCLRDEYVEKALLNEYASVDAAFKVAFDPVTCRTEGNFPADFTLGKEEKIYWWDYSRREESATVYHQVEEVYKESSYFGLHAAVIASYNSGLENNNVTYVECYTNGEVVNATGTLKLLP